MSGEIAKGGAVAEGGVAGTGVAAGGPAGFSPKAWWAYLQERFPPGLNGMAIFLLYSCNLLAAGRMLDFPAPRPLPYLLGFLWALGVFYHLRVMDDLKDRVADTAAYPGRVLSRGLLSYRHLAVTGVIAFAMETAVASRLGPKILALHAAVFAYSWLMYKEFCVREWLKGHLFIYGLSHMLILSIIDFTILQMADAHGTVARAPGFLLFASLSFFMTFSMEVARKIRLPASERPEVDTYSKVVGVGGAMALVHALQLAVLAAALLLRASLHLPIWFYAASVAAWAGVAAWYALWRPGLTEARSRKLDKVASLFFLEFYFGLLGILAWRTWGA
jgi:hypothetical protein